MSIQPIEPDISHLIRVVDMTIEDLADDFQNDGAFSFATEADVQSTLLGRLRANDLLRTEESGIRTELVYAEFPAYGTSWRGAPRHDLTVWHPDFVKAARER